MGENTQDNQGAGNRPLGLAELLDAIIQTETCFKTARRSRVSA
jgi:hypothetical protein